MIPGGALVIDTATWVRLLAREKPMSGHDLKREIMFASIRVYSRGAGRVLRDNKNELGETPNP